MRFLHTSDWHLGRLFHGVHLTRDQEHVLEQFVTLVGEADLDAVIIAGDIYDRAIPPPAAVDLLSDVLERIVIGHGTPVIAIAGNHDSPQRVGFGSALMRERGLHIVGPLTASPPAVIIEAADGPVHVHPLPYAEPTDVRLTLGDDTLRTHDLAMRAMTARSLLAAEGTRAEAPDARHVLVAHAFVVGGTGSDSERPLSVGGSDMVSVEAFDGFDYVALGHLHRPQRAGGRDHVRYSGSLLKYSFSEAEHVKGVGIVELAADGSSTYEAVPLTPLRDVRIIEGRLKDLLANPAPELNREDYILARLTDEGALLDAMGRLQTIYPNALQLERTALAPGAGSGAAPSDYRARSDHDLFADFFEHATGNALTQAQAEVLDNELDALRRARRGGA